MIGFNVRTIDETKNVKTAADRAVYKSLGHAAASIRKTARGLIVTSAEPAAPGEPVHTRHRRLPNAIVYDVSRDRQYAIIGPARSFAGPVGGAHEHGGEFRGQRYEPRPFMGPAMTQNSERFARSWSASIGP